MNTQQRAVLITARLKASTYPGDRIEALKEANAIAQEDSLIAGVELLDTFLGMTQDKETNKEPLLYTALNKIFLGPSGKEFIEIFLKEAKTKESIIQVLIETELEEVQETIKILIKSNPKSLLDHIIQSPTQIQLFTEAVKGRVFIIDIVILLSRRSKSLKKLLIFNGFIEGMISLSKRAKNREVIRHSLNALSQLMIDSLESVKYFLELKWKEWLIQMLNTQTHHALKIVYSISLFPETKEYLFPMLPIVLEIKDPLALYLIIRHYPEGSIFIGDIPANPKYISIYKDITSTRCMTRWNILYGLESSLQEYTSVPITSDIGSIRYLGYITYHKPEVDETEVAVFLYNLAKIQSIPLVESILYLKTAIVLYLRTSLEILISTGILEVIRELIEIESTPLEIKALSTYWMLLAYLNTPAEAKDKSNYLFSVLNNETLKYIQYFISSFYSTTNRICSKDSCLRCYYLDISADTPELPVEIDLISQTLWVPSTVQILILEKYTQYIKETITIQQQNNLDRYISLLHKPKVSIEREEKGIPKGNKDSPTGKTEEQTETKEKIEDKEERRTNEKTLSRNDQVFDL
ncbi:hypothetical protein NEOKW01_0932 [Nematocida sp. AWRm80]|nr:hypothetical protein NEOKW01_0932 [Nematocida sp. AWRm80]